MDNNENTFLGLLILFIIITILGYSVHKICNFFNRTNIDEQRRLNENEEPEDNELPPKYEEIDN